MLYYSFIHLVKIISNYYILYIIEFSKKAKKKVKTNDDLIKE